MKKLILVLLMIFVVPSAQATIYCAGVIDTLVIYKGGNLNVNMSWQTDNNLYVLCNSENEWNGIDAGTCLQWYGLAKTAYENNERVVLQYFTDGSCSDLPTWANSLTPGYFALKR